MSVGSLRNWDSLISTCPIHFHAVFPRFSALGYLLIFEVFGGALNRTGALTRASTLIKTYENLDLPFPAHNRTLFIIYDN